MKKQFITFRRYYLDEFLEKNRSTMLGKVLDVGGKKDNPRGYFRPPLQQVKSWEYLNIDESTNPDYKASVYQIPCPSNTFNTVLMCETLEHLDEPEKALNEVFRVLNDGGALIVTMPLFYPLHSDPNDYQRWSDQKIYSALSKQGFSQIIIYPMGGMAAVIYDLVNYYLKKAPKQDSLFLKVVKKIVHSSVPIIKYLESRSQWMEQYVTTGYLAIAYKNRSVIK